MYMRLTDGQGYHNLASLQENDMRGCSCWMPGDDGDCPYRNEAHVDAVLTAVGIEQAREAGDVLRLHARNGAKPQKVLVSPLTRTLQTATLAVESAAATSEANCIPDFGALPFEAVENIRERLGPHHCNKRRSKEEVSPLFDHVDFGNIASGPDKLFRSNVWETNEEIGRRSKGVFLDLQKREENCLIVVGHSSLFSATLRHAFEIDDEKGNAYAWMFKFVFNIESSLIAFLTCRTFHTLLIRCSAFSTSKFCNRRSALPCTQLFMIMYYSY
jgi:broad specificity phosphatase PhoE